MRLPRLFWSGGGWLELSVSISRCGNGGQLRRSSVVSLWCVGCAGDRWRTGGPLQSWGRTILLLTSSSSAQENRRLWQLPGGAARCSMCVHSKSGRHCLQTIYNFQPYPIPTVPAYSLAFTTTNGLSQHARVGGCITPQPRPPTGPRSPFRSSSRQCCAGGPGAPQTAPAPSHRQDKPTPAAGRGAAQTSSAPAR